MQQSLWDLASDTPVSQDEINGILWKACDTFRGTIDPSEYKNYILVMLFLKYISDVWRDDYEKYKLENPDDPDRVARKMQFERFVIPEGADFYAIYQRRDADNLGEIIDTSLEAIERENKEKLEGVFRNISFNSEAALGRTAQRNERLKNLLNDFAVPKLNLRPSRIGGQDIIGNAYEYLIARFASDAGKKAGEFYTPPEVSELLAQLLDPQPGDRICDPACGSGSLLIKCAKQVGSNDYSVWGQEANGATWALCMMNMFLHNTQAKYIAWGDTLQQPMLLEGNRLARFNVVVANPPFSLDKWGAEKAATDPYKRFYRGVPPKSKGDYAFITHMIETTYLDPEQNGRVGVVVPHGVLFRGSSEGTIRKALIDENLLDAVIGLPANLFFGTGIPAAILIFKRQKADDSVLFIDASRDFEPGTTQNRLRSEDIDKVLTTYHARQTVEKYAYLASYTKIVDNDCNLNIPRYVDTFEQEAQIDLTAVQAEIKALKAQLGEVESKMEGYLKELGLGS